MTGASLLAGAAGDVYPDADAFSNRVRRHPLFVPDEPIVVARAPGRFDVLGGIADYAGGLVLGLPIGAAALAAVQAADDGRVTAVSGTPNSCEIGSMINRKIVKSKESRVQPSHAAHQAVHCSLVGSFHQATDSARAAATVMLPPLRHEFRMAEARFVSQARQVFPRRCRMVK